MSASRTPRLAALIRREIDAPIPIGELASAGAASEDGQMFAELLQARLDWERAHWFVEAEPVYLRKLTWRLARPLLALGLVAAIGFSLQHTVDPTLSLSLFLLGAASLYVAIQFFSHLWARTDRKRLEAVEQSYRERLQNLLGRTGSA